jgi:hypothetical protein
VIIDRITHCKSVVAMTELLERAIARLKTLPANEQDAIAKRCCKQIASMIMEELEDDLRWDEAFSRSPDTLAKLALTNY